MERLTLREAAERSSRSVTTLRRYIRSGRLHAEKRDGRFGPEYYVALEDLVEAGLDPDAHRRRSSLASRPAAADRLPAPAAPTAAEGVPLSLYQELLMKHEQLLVQYGMLRAGASRETERDPLVETANRLLAGEEASGRRKAETRSLRTELDAARKELDGKDLEIAALQEKVKALEMMTRNSVTNEAIDEQFRQVREQSRKVDALRSRREWSPDERAAWRPSSTLDPTDH